MRSSHKIQRSPPLATARTGMARGPTTTRTRPLTPAAQLVAVVERASIAAQEGSEDRTLGRLLADGSLLFSAELLSSVVVQLPSTVSQRPVAVPELPTAVSPAPATHAPTPALAPQAAAAPSAVEPAATVGEKVQGAPNKPEAGLGELARRRRFRVMREIIEAAERAQQRGQVRKGFRPTYTKAPAGKPKYDSERIMSGLAQLETLVPGFQFNLEAMPVDKWAELALDIANVAKRLVALKAEWRTVDLTVLLLKYPKALLMTPEQIKTNAVQVRELLKTAKDADSIIQAVPQMLTPQVAASVLVTINKWWQFKQDPVAILESDPTLVLRAQEMDQPFEPVYQAADGTWVVPGANKAKRPEWAQAIAERSAKQRNLRQQQQQQQAASHALPPDSVTSAAPA